VGVSLSTPTAGDSSRPLTPEFTVTDPNLYSADSEIRDQTTPKSAGKVRYLRFADNEAAKGWETLHHIGDHAGSNGSLPTMPVLSRG
jgi:hypothetical protein